jgi:hypothetical protein
MTTCGSGGVAPVFLASALGRGELYALTFFIPEEETPVSVG